MSRSSFGSFFASSAVILPRRRKRSRLLGDVLCPCFRSLVFARPPLPAPSPRSRSRARPTPTAPPSLPRSIGWSPCQSKPVGLWRLDGNHRAAYSSARISLGNNHSVIKTTGATNATRRGYGREQRSRLRKPIESATTHASNKSNLKMPPTITALKSTKQAIYLSINRSINRPPTPTIHLGGGRSDS